jgi:pimeloyl-ACP methyl ester carboxylesterase
MLRAFFHATLSIALVLAPAAVPLPTHTGRTVPIVEPPVFASAATLVSRRARNVVLVHGLFADGSSWSEVIARLQAAGLNVTAVQNPLTTLDDAVAETQRVLARQDGPTVLVGHSFAGMIVTEAGIDPKV